MCTVKRKYTRRISVWVLVFALCLSALTTSLLLPVRADSWMHDGANDVRNDTRSAVDSAGDAVRDATNATKKAVGDLMDPNVSEGRVLDGDGVIGNEANSRMERQGSQADTSGGWLGWVIAVVVALIVLVLIVVLIPKKKER